MTDYADLVWKESNTVDIEFACIYNDLDRAKQTIEWFAGIKLYNMEVTIIDIDKFYLPS